MVQDMYKINSITIDSTNSVTDLCLLGVKYPTDKSPYNTEGNLHKHAYTAIYNLLFSNIRYKDIKLGELGILDNNSMLSWREFFPNAKLYGFEWFDERLDKAIEVLRVALAQPEPEPVAWRFHDGKMWCYVNHLTDLPTPKFEPLYIHPPSREWVSLTDEEIKALLPGAVRVPPGWRETVAAVEAKLKEKNHG